jgi:hypothetical protein
MRLAGCCLLAGTLIVAATAGAQDDETPDLAFLEYLGSWDESDEEWLVVAEEILAPGDAPDAPESDSDNVEQDNEDQNLE